MRCRNLLLIAQGGGGSAVSVVYVGVLKGRTGHPVGYEPVRVHLYGGSSPHFSLLQRSTVNAILWFTGTPVMTHMDRIGYMPERSGGPCVMPA
jgi:hypothetical protein